MSRYYKIGKHEYPSVTTITDQLAKPALYGFFAKYGMKKAKEIGKEATDIGNNVHQYIQEYYNNELKGMSELNGNKQYYNCIHNFHKFQDKYNLSPKYQELVVYSHKHKYAGTLDLCNPLIDWKTSSAIYPEYELQLEAYYRALTEMINDGIIKLEKPKDFWVVRLDKGKEIKFKRDVKKFKPNKQRFDAFLGLLKVYNWRNEK